MQNKALLSLIFLLTIQLVSSAQLGSLKDKLKAKVAENAPSTPAIPDDVANGESGGKKMKKNIDFDFSSSALSPSIEFRSILDDAFIHNATNGTFRMPNLTAAFLPTKLKNGSPAQYESWNNSSPPIWADIIKKDDNSIMGTLYYYGKPLSPPFFQLEQLETMEVERFEGFKQGGEYDLKFYLGGTHFYTFPFKLVEKTSSDPYSPAPKMLFLEGEWDKWAFFELGDKGALVWNFFATHQTMDIPNSARWDVTKVIKYKVQIKKGNAIIGVYDQQLGEGKENSFGEARPRNGKQTLITNSLLKHPKNGRDRVPLTLSDLSNGSYDIQMQFFDGDQKIGERAYSFSVADGKILPPVEADRSKHQDKLTIVEQGRKSFFVKRK
ncbi:MAG: hypothetical protein KDC49_04050 [Saprospiraceae bacterium]|nr:hypothetical protein [Saprospiraceae bacterium]